MESEIGLTSTGTPKTAVDILTEGKLREFKGEGANNALIPGFWIVKCGIHKLM